MDRLRVLLGAIALAALFLYPRVLATLANPQAEPSWLSGDLDTSLIHGGVSRAKDLGDTLQWWVGPWAGQVPFYRPLTSYVFWLEWLAFGSNERLYVLPTAAAHLAATAAFALFVFRLAGASRWSAPVIAALAAAFQFAGGPSLSSPRPEVAHLVGGIWKNQPDSLAALCCCLSLVCYLNAREAGRLPFGAALWYLAGCLFKEIAVPLFLIFPCLELLLAPVAALRKSWIRFVPVAAAGVLFLAARQLALGSVGFTYGTNFAWLERTLIHAAGPFGARLVYREWLAPANALWACVLTFLAVRAHQRFAIRAPSQAPRIRFALIFGTLCLFLVGWTVLGALALADGSFVGTPTPVERLVAGGLYSFESPRAGYLVASIMWLLVIHVVARASPGLLLLSLVWTLGFLAPLTLSPGPLHRYYLPQAGYLLLDACAASLVVGWLYQRFRGIRPTPSQPAPQ